MWESDHVFRPREFGAWVTGSLGPSAIVVALAFAWNVPLPLGLVQAVTPNFASVQVASPGFAGAPLPLLTVDPSPQSWSNGYSETFTMPPPVIGTRVRSNVNVALVTIDPVGICEKSN